MKTPKELVDSTSVELTMFDGGVFVRGKRSKEWEVYFFKNRTKTLSAYASIGGFDAHKNLRQNPFITEKERAIIRTMLVLQGPLLLQN